MASKSTALCVLGASCFTLISGQAKAQAVMQAEDQFQEVFVTGGYSAAFGAATALAIVVFLGNPEANMRFVLGGASAGFVAGSAYAFYRISLANKATAYPMNYSEEDGYLPPSPPAARNEYPTGASINRTSPKYAFGIPRVHFTKEGTELSLLRLKF